MDSSAQPPPQPSRWWPLRKRQNFLITTLALFELLEAPSIIKMHTDHDVLDLTAILLAITIPAIGAVSAGFWLWPLVRRD